MSWVGNRSDYTGLTTACQREILSTVLALEEVFGIYYSDILQRLWKFY